MNFDSLFPFLFIPFFIFILFMVLSKRGRNTGIKMMFGDIVQDYGELGTTQLKMGFTQSIRLLKCQKDTDIFYVLETTDSRPGSIQTTWTKIDVPTLAQISALIQQP